MECLRFIRQSLQELVIYSILLFFNQIHLSKNFLLRNFELRLSLPNLDQLFKRVGKISLILDVHLVELPSILNPEERGDLSKPLFSGSFEFFKDIFDSFDKLHFFVFGGFTFFDFAIENIVVLLLGVEKRFHFGHMFGWLGSNEGLESILDSIQISANFNHFTVFFFQLSKSQRTCLSIVFNFYRMVSISFSSLRFLAQNCSDL